MRVAITGAHGFLGRNLTQRLFELGVCDVVPITRETLIEALPAKLADADLVYHLAGVNRPTDPADFDRGNRLYTAHVLEALASASPNATVVLASSTQAQNDSPYGASKRAAEHLVHRFGHATGGRVEILRLTNVFGKWARPNYNSAVATFCYNIARGLPITVHDASATLRLSYVDDVVDAFLSVAKANETSIDERIPVYETTVGAVAEEIAGFAASRDSLMVGDVGVGLSRALYATYISYLPPERFDYQLQRHEDPRGVFVEVLRTPRSGQFSYFTAHPGITRGEHYHHSKTEKFLVLSGTARFAFRHIVTDERHEIVVHGEDARVVETIPGWTHNITNVGTEMMIVMLWANELFDRDRPDTVGMKVDVG